MTSPPPFLDDSPLLNVPGHRPAPTRSFTENDPSKLAPELDRRHLAFEPHPFAGSAFSDVYPGRWAPPDDQEHPDGIEVAIKVFRLGEVLGSPTYGQNYDTLGKRLGREVYVWQRVRHPRITPFIGYIREFKDEIIPCIVSARRKANLVEYLARVNPHAHRLRLLIQILEGLVYLHTFTPGPIVHLDIKPDNILVTEDGDAELTDFGHAKILDGVSFGFSTGANPGGSYAYMAPETLMGTSYLDLTPGADIYAIGSTILYVLSGLRAWYPLKSKGLLTIAIVKGELPKRVDHRMSGSEEAVQKVWELLSRCWKMRPADRPSAQEVLDELYAIDAMGGVGLPPRIYAYCPPTNGKYSIVQPGVKLTQIQPELEGELARPATTLMGGGHADVYKGQWIGPDQKTIDVAIKVLRVARISRTKMSGKLRTIDIRMKRETLIWTRARHPNIHTFLGYRLSDVPQLISPWCAHGNLTDYLTRNEDLPKHRKLRLINQAALGLAYLHSQNPPICHADIKPENILVNDSLEAVITDFGVSRVLESVAEHTGLTTRATVNGTDRYTAPELLNPEFLEENRKPGPSRESDAYAFGGLTLAVMSGKVPFHLIKRGSLIMMKIMGNETPEPKDHEQLAESDPLWSLMNSCWQFNPSDRLSLTGVLERINDIPGY